MLICSCFRGATSVSALTTLVVMVRERAATSRVMRPLAAVHSAVEDTVPTMCTVYQVCINCRGGRGELGHHFAVVI